MFVKWNDGKVCMQIAKVPSLKGSILCVCVCVGGGAFKFKEEKNHGVLSEMTEAFESKRFESKRLWKERKTRQP